MKNWKNVMFIAGITLTSLLSVSSAFAIGGSSPYNYNMACASGTCPQGVGSDSPVYESKYQPGVASSPVNKSGNSDAGNPGVQQPENVI